MFAKRQLISFIYDEVIDILMRPNSDFCALKNVRIIYRSEIPIFKKKSWFHMDLATESDSLLQAGR